MLVETARSLQLAEPTHDEFLRVEMHGLTWTNLSNPGGAQHGRCGVEAEEMQFPSIRATALDTIKEGAMAVVQQMLSEKVTMTIRDEPLTRQRDRHRLDVAQERRVRVWSPPEPFVPRNSDGGEVGQQGGSEGLQVGHGSCI